MRTVCTTFVIVPLLLVAIFGRISSALPSSDADVVYRLLSQYGSRANFPDADLSNLLEEQRSMKRGLGPRPLRFG
uniref:FMRFa-like peptide 14 n=1 Tax=Ascaris suum TaxID=6253 RepID=A0A0E3X1R3_ASCSU|nr:FMRFa-like peptide precursor 14 [Ascaris suum]